MPGLLNIPVLSPQKRPPDHGKKLAKTETAGSAPPRILSGGSGNGDGREKRILYICASTADRLSQIEQCVTRIIPSVGRRVDILRYTQPWEFEKHALLKITQDESSYAGICVRLDPTNVDEFFGIMCRLALALIPASPGDEDIRLRAMRIMVTRFITFGNLDEETLILTPDHASWDSYFDLTKQHQPTSEELRLIHTIQGPQVDFSAEFDEGMMCSRLWMADPNGD